MNNLTITLHAQEPELGEIISDASSNPIIKVEMEPFYAPVPVWMASLEFNGRTYRLYAREVVDEEPEIKEDKSLPNWHPFGTDEPVQEVEEPSKELLEIYKKYALDDEGDEPERVIEPDDFYNNYLGEIDGILNRGTKPSGRYTQATQIYNLVRSAKRIKYRCSHQYVCGMYRSKRVE